MAYIYKNSDGSRGETGYYSTVGVVKCTSKPEVSIVGLKTGERNAHLYSYLGHYKQDIDYTEKVYSYNFKIWDTNSNLIADSGELLHVYSNDDSSNESTDEFVITQELTQSTSYYIQYTITTNNKMKISSPRYRIAQKTICFTEMEAELITELNFENGYINVSLKGKDWKRIWKNYLWSIFYYLAEKKVKPVNEKKCCVLIYRERNHLLDHEKILQ